MICEFSAMPKLLFAAQTKLLTRNAQEILDTSGKMQLHGSQRTNEPPV